MALDPDGLKADLETFFGDPSSTRAGCASQWAACMQGYASAVVPPLVTGVAAAAALALAGALTNAFASATCVADVEVAFLGFATAIGVGMAPTYVSTPPPGPVGFVEEIGKPPSEWAATQKEAAELWAGKIHDWMTSGIATLAVPPNTPVNWS
jgi:hypothetical protein